MKKKSRHHLGQLTDLGLKNLQEQLVNQVLKPDKHGLSYIDDYVRGTTPIQKSFGYLNGLGYTYGYALAEAFLNDFLHAETSQDAEKAAVIASEDINIWVNDVIAQVPTMGFDLIRTAREVVGDRMPAGEDPEKMMRIGREHEAGLYIRDFYWSVVTSLQISLGVLQDFLSWNKVTYPVTYDPGQREYIPELFLEPSRDELKRAIKASNQEIAKRTYYGRRSEELPKHPNFTILGWSNGSQKWNIMWGYIQGAIRKVMLGNGGSIELDANYVLVPAHPSVIKLVVDELDPLPLYEYSTEAKERGDYPKAYAPAVRKVIRAIIDAEAPDEESEERAIMAMDLWELVEKARNGQHGAQQALGIVLGNLKNTPMPYLQVLTEWLDT